MIRKLIAGTLLILIVLPFTAPFATVDMPTLLGERSSAASEQTLLTPRVEDGSHALVAPAARLRVRFRSVLRLDASVAAPRVSVLPGHRDRTPSAARRLAERPSLTSLRL